MPFALRHRAGRAAPAAILMLLPACVARPLPPIDAALLAAAAAAGNDAGLVRSGRELLAGPCAACHRPVQPLALSPEAWDAVLPRMLVKAHLGADAGVAIRAYVQAAHKAAPAN